MTTPDPITTAREAVLELRQIACLLNDDQAQTGANFDRETAIIAALDYAEKLKAERDEALCRLLSAGSEKPTAEDMDWAISLSASLRREEITVEDNEITRLTSQLEQAERVIAPFANCLFGGSPGHVHFSAASQWIKDSQAKGEAS